MKKIFLLLIAFCALSSAQGQNQDSILMHIEGYPLSIQNFLQTTHLKKGADKAELQKQVQAYIDFRLQLMEAQQLGLLKDSTVLTELNGYRKDLVPLYLNEEAAKEKVAKDIIYERMQQEVHASHILIAIKDWKNIQEITTAKAKIDSLYEAIQAGANFTELAQQHSQDPAAVHSKGDLGYITSPQVDGAFEDALYSLEEGEMSKPIRTPHGLHLIKVHQHIPNRGSRLVSHIMLRARTGLPSEDSLAKVEQIQGIYQSLQNGAQWDTLCLSRSQHDASKRNHGQIDWFWGGKMPKAFEEATYALTEKGQYTNPVRTSYGWHIIRLDSIRPLQPFEDLQPTILAHLKKDTTRQNLITTAYYEWLEEETKFSGSEQKETFLNVFDEKLIQGQWKFTADTALLSQPICYFDNRPIPSFAFFQFVGTNQRAIGLPLSTYVEVMYRLFVRDVLQTYAEATLDQKYPEYRKTMQQYTEAVLATEVKKREVWDKAAKDSVGLKDYFIAHQQKYHEAYRWPMRVKAHLLSSRDSMKLETAVNHLATGDYPVKSWASEPLFFSLTDSIITLHKRQVLYKAHESDKRISDSYIQIAGHRSADISDGLYEQYRATLEKEILRLGASQDQIKFVLGSSDTLNTPASCHFTLEVRATGFKAITNAVSSISKKEGLFDVTQMPEAIQFAKGVQRIRYQNEFYWVNVQEVEAARPKLMDEIKGLVIRDYQAEQEQKWIESLRKKYKVEIHENVVNTLLKI
jgi:peptidyl-prolyl cis-trans isomerase SurA